MWAKVMARVERRERGSKVKTLAIVMLLVACALPLCAQVQDVPKDHWAYQAVRELAGKGYVLGYPDGSFLGDRTLTRYEFATIVQRVLQQVDTDIAKAAAKSSPAMDGGTVTQTALALDTPVEGMSSTDLDKINKLINEFKVELTIIGTRLDKVEATVEEMKAMVENHEATLTDEEGALKSTQADVSKLKKVKIGGYLQVRYQESNYADENKTESSAVETFLVRRARVKFTFTPTERTTVVIQPELAKNSVTLKDTYINYALGENSALAPSFQIGQQNWWFGYEVPYSSSKRETPERSLVSRRFFPGERDQGAVIFASTNSQFQWTVGAYNGTGTEKSSYQDVNDAKDALVRLQWQQGDLDFGMSGYRGRGAWTTFGDAASYQYGVQKIRYGADAQYYMNRLTLKAEYMRGKGFDQAANTWNQDEYTSGYYAQLAYNIDALDTLVARYSSLENDPTKPNYGRRSAWDLGIIRWLDDSTRLKLFYQINKEETNSINNNAWAAEWIATY